MPACPPKSVLPVFIDSTMGADNASVLGLTLAMNGCPFARLGKPQGKKEKFDLSKKPGKNGKSINHMLLLFI